MYSPTGGVSRMTTRAFTIAAISLVLAAGAPDAISAQATDATYKARREQLAKELEATEKAIREMGATCIPETEMEVDEGRVGFAGLVKVASD